jgi:hypothetical protein
MARELTDAERRQGYERIDPDTGQPLRRGWMSRAEFAAWWPSMTAGWRAAMFDPSRPPKDEGDWVWDERHGWLRTYRGPKRRVRR